MTKIQRRWMSSAFPLPSYMQLAQNFPHIFQTTCSHARKPKQTVNIIEVGPRDGLQNERKLLTVEQKSVLIHKLGDCGIRDIECGSLVNYNLVPQMQGTPDVIKQIQIRAGLKKSILVPHVNYLKQYQDILPLVDEVVLFVSASNTFNSKNINANVDSAFARFQAIKQFLNNHPDPHVKQIALRGSISCCWGCPYEGEVKYHQIADIINKYINDIQTHSVDICDTIGVATPETTHQLLHRIQQEFAAYHVPFTVHLHDTNGQAVHSAITAVDLGYKHIHSSVAGLGGCPFSNKRVGNLDTVKLVEALHSHGVYTGIHLPDLRNTAKWIKELLLR